MLLLYGSRGARRDTGGAPCAGRPPEGSPGIERSLCVALGGHSACVSQPMPPQPPEGPARKTDHPAEAHGHVGEKTRSAPVFQGHPVGFLWITD
jgi:hypothetical protein